MAGILSGITWAQENSLSVSPNLNSQTESDLEFDANLPAFQKALPPIVQESQKLSELANALLAKENQPVLVQFKRIVKEVTSVTIATKSPSEKLIQFYGPIERQAKTSAIVSIVKTKSSRGVISYKATLAVHKM